MFWNQEDKIPHIYKPLIVLISPPKEATLSLRRRLVGAEPWF